MLKLRTILLYNYPYYILLIVVILLTIFRLNRPCFSSSYHSHSRNFTGIITNIKIEGDLLQFTLKDKNNEKVIASYYFNNQKEKITYSTYFHLIGASSVDDHGQFVYEDYISGLPYATDKDFVPALKRIVKERSVDAIYPAMDLVIPLLKEVEDELGCMVISSSLETTKICLSKELTYHTLQHVVRTPRLYSSDEVERYPVFVKPKIGYGAKGTCKINSRKELDSFIAGKDGLLICEYLPGEEYTVDCFTDKDGCLLYSAARKRNRVKDGISVNTFFVEQQEEFEMLAQKMNASIRFRGAWFYQVKRNRDGELCLLEIASRLGGSSLLSRAVGVNFALLSFFDAFGYKVSI